MDEMSINFTIRYPIDASNADMVRGRELAREAITEALSEERTDSSAGFKAATLDALAPTLLGGSPATAVGFIAELLSWVQVSVQLAARLQQRPVDEVVGAIITGLNNPKASS